MLARTTKYRSPLFISCLALGMDPKDRQSKTEEMHCIHTTASLEQCQSPFRMSQRTSDRSAGGTTPRTERASFLIFSFSCFFALRALCRRMTSVFDRMPQEVVLLIVQALCTPMQGSSRLNYRSTRALCALRLVSKSISSITTPAFHKHVKVFLSPERQSELGRAPPMRSLIANTHNVRITRECWLTEGS